jgi:hypothetical protein
MVYTMYYTLCTYTMYYTPRLIVQCGEAETTGVRGMMKDSGLWDVHGMDVGYAWVCCIADECSNLPCDL